MKSLVNLPDEELIAQFNDGYLNDLDQYCAEEGKYRSELIIMPSHVIKAKQILWKKSRKYNLFDGSLALGSAFLGATLPHLFELAEAGVQPNLLLIYSGVVGGFLLGMGVIGKAKED